MEKYKGSVIIKNSLKKTYLIKQVVEEPLYRPFKVGLRTTLRHQKDGEHMQPKTFSTSGFSSTNGAVFFLIIDEH